MKHTHTYDTEVFHIGATIITTAVMGCRCGAVASVGEGQTNLIWEPEPAKEEPCKRTRYAMAATC